MPSSHISVARRPLWARAFTLMELLVVVGIIAVLVAITFMVGRAVTANSKRGITQDTIRILDSALAAYVAAKGEIPPPWLDDPRLNSATKRVPIADARDMGATDTNGASPESTVIDSTALFVKQCESVPEAKAILDRLPSRVAARRAVRVGTGTPATADLTVVLDGWGRPIRYVHPAFSVTYQASTTSALLVPPKQDDGSATTWSIDNIRRTHAVQVDPYATASPLPSAFPDSDGGRCPGGRPYFYSAGEDGLVGRLEGTVEFDWDKDNVYSTIPNRPTN